jgi:hypothetical protein
VTVQRLIAVDDAGTLLGGVKGGNQHPGAPCLGAAVRSPSTAQAPGCASGSNPRPPPSP